MTTFIIINFFLPVIAAISMLLLKKEDLQRAVAIVSLVVLSISSFYLLSVNQSVHINIPHLLEYVLIGADIILLLFFAKVGISAKNPKIYALAFLQLFLYLFLESGLPDIQNSLIVVDKLSIIMFVIINVVGSSIILFSTRYMRDEDSSPFRKSLFQAYLFLFLSVMSIAVSANSILLFFLLFEATTLFSYLLIRFRGDETAVANSERALWMNQIGGVAILLGVIYSVEIYETFYFSELIANADPAFLLPFAFISMAAFVKGASMPFEKWLLGAMVAPTPVSAMLHSATMVKIAPFIILKLSPAIAGTILGSYISVFGALVFMVASFLALSKDFFKEILGLSTIALLGLMMALSTIESSDSFFIVAVLIIFHAISKAILFLGAGVLEKEYHFKYVEDFKDLLSTSPYLVFFIIFGFASMTLPPFGVFMGKLMAIETLSQSIGNNVLLILPLIFLGVGSTLLTLLYFKVAATLFVINEESSEKRKKNDMGFFFPLLFLTLLGVALILFINIPPILLGTLIVVTIAPFLFKRFTFDYDQVKEYNCGERYEYAPNLYFFNIDEKLKGKLTKTFIGIFLLIPVIGALL